MTDNRFINRSELIGILVLAVFLVVILPLCLDVFRLNLVAKYLTYAFVALGLVICWGYGGILSLGQGGVLRSRRLLHGDVSQARSIEPREHQDPVDPRHSRFHGLESDHLACRCSGSPFTVSPSPLPPSSWCRASLP